MKGTKTEFKYFTILEWKQEQNYLRQQHKNGWKFVNVNLIGFYHFEKCEPEDVVYQLDYNPEGIAHKEEYVQMFRDCGWEYLQDYVGYSYFRKSASEMNGNEEIFCDDASRMDMMIRVFKGRMLPLLCIIFLCIPNIFMQDRLGNNVLSFMFIAVFVLCLILFVSFGIQFWKYRNSLRR